MFVGCFLDRSKFFKCCLKMCSVSVHDRFLTMRYLEYDLKIAEKFRGSEDVFHYINLALYLIPGGPY